MSHAPYVPYIWYVTGKKAVCLHPATLQERAEMVALLRKLGRRMLFGRLS
jgi:hypothetical protein